jgi:hypothetical protein
MLTLVYMVCTSSLVRSHSIPFGVSKYGRYLVVTIKEIQGFEGKMSTMCELC